MSGIVRVNNLRNVSDLLWNVEGQVLFERKFGSKVAERNAIIKMQL